ncbi:MAG TPA: M24 family metallopeptidase [Homoserinimonas sp.]|nr:M24 family metallopeptidase [Homoserinimonas sp.]
MASVVPGVSVRQEVLTAIRARAAARGVDAYLAYTPSNVFYTSGFQSYFLMEWWRMLGTVMVLVPTDPALEPAIMISDFEAEQAARVSGIHDVRSYRMWVELRNAGDLQTAEGDGSTEPPRPAQYDASEQDDILRDILTDRGLLNSRIGTDLRYILNDTVTRIATSAPNVSLVDMTEDLYEIRSIKFDFEVERLRRATELSEAGMIHAVTDLRPGITAADVRLRYAQGVLKLAGSSERYAGYSDNWVLPAVGSGTQIGVDSESGGGLAAGDFIKFDCGATLGGYRGDGGRTFAYQEVRPKARMLYSVLSDAHEKAREQIKPGVPINAIFTAAETHIRQHGYPRFTRGHYGHSVGIDTFHEEPPYISGVETRLLEAGMVLAVETPAYSADTGAVMIEDLILVTETGHEVLHKLPYDLQVVD